MATASSKRSPVVGSINSAKRARAGAKAWRRRSIGAAMATACGPLRRTMPMPPRPGGVAIATMVSGEDKGINSLILGGVAGFFCAELMQRIQPDYIKDAIREHSVYPPLIRAAMPNFRVVQRKLPSIFGR